MSKFLVYYGDGTIVEGKVGDELPSTINVQFILDVDSRTGPYLAEAGDFYIYEWNHDVRGKWIAADWFGFFQYMQEYQWRSMVMFGRTIDNDKFLEIGNAARKKLYELRDIWYETRQTKEAKET